MLEPTIGKPDAVPAVPDRRHGPGTRLVSLGAAAGAIIRIALVVVGVGFLLALLKPVVTALVVALFIAVALRPVVEVLVRRGVRPGLAAATGMLIVVAGGMGVILLVVSGVVRQWDQLGHEIDAAVDKLGETLASAGIDASVAESARQSIVDHLPTIISGILPTISRLVGTVATLAIGLFLALFTCFFMLKDGPSMTRRAVAVLPLRPDAGERWFADTGRMLRRYIVGMTLLGAFNAVVVGAGAVILQLPLIGSIMVVTLLGNYVPYLGAFVAGAFAVLIALSAGGVDTALWMLLFVIIANGSLQTVLTPFAYGAALNLSPLTTLLVTILGGLIAGALGVALAAPIAAIILHTFRQTVEPVTVQRDP
jgi:predicted PurR-regulated permease PerM